MSRTALVSAVLVMVGAGCSSRESAKSEGPAKTAYAFTLDRGFQLAARNEAQGFDVGLDRAEVGVHLTAEPSVGWSMHLVSFGRKGSMRAADDVSPVTNGARLEYARTGSVTEWYVNEARGLEQGFTFARRPDGNGELAVEIATEGSLQPMLGSSGSVVEARDAKGRTRLEYGELAARDARGRMLPARLGVDGSHIVLHVDDASAEYPIEIDPLTWAQQAKLVASPSVPGEAFGAAVAIRGDTALVGADGGTGAVYVFVRSGASWTQQARLVASDGAIGDRFGSSVALDGDTAVIGAQGKASGAGAAYVFVRSSGTWSEQAKLVPGEGVTTDDRYGSGVAILGGAAVVGAYGKGSFLGASFFFTRLGTTWSEKQKLTAGTKGSNEKCGWSVALTTTMLVIGCPGANTSTGRAIVFEPIGFGASWIETKTLVASAPDGTTLEYFGETVAADIDTIAVGEAGKSGVFVFLRSGGLIKPQQKLVGIDTLTSDTFGRTVGLDGDEIITGSKTGAYIFTRAGTIWSQVAKIKSSDYLSADDFAKAASISGDAVLVGAPSKATNTGAAYVFRYLLPNGDTCTSGTSCLSGVCVDGVCCDRACTGQCEACDVPLAVGTCTTIAGAPHGSRTACAGDGTECGQRVCDGSDTTACHFPPVTKVCGAATCALGVETHVAKCTGLGKCGDVPVACGAYKCGLTACGTSCVSSADCVPGNYCKDGPDPKSCVPLEGLGKACSLTIPCGTGLVCTDGFCCGVASCGPGSTCGYKGHEGTCIKLEGTKCSSGLECGSANCVDGTCCDSPCNGQCEACDIGTEGKCSAVSGAPHGARALCSDGGGDVCKIAVCDGAKDRTACVGFKNGTTTECKAGSCTGSDYQGPSTCDGAGGCLAPKVTSCVPFACDAKGCLKTCTTDAECSSAFKCVAGNCVEGARCSDDKLSSIGKDGKTTSCAPFRCGPDGQCLKQCAVASDCAPGFACNPDTKNCENGDGGGTTSDSGGCGCRTTGNTNDESFTPSAILSALAIVLARRRAKSRRG